MDFIPEDEAKRGKRLHLCLARMGGNELKYIENAINTNWVTSLGPNVDAFESQLEQFLLASTEDEDASRKGMNSNLHPYVLALSSGTAAIHLGLILLGIKPGDEVICQSWTFAASVNPVKYLGASPVFVDSEPLTWNADPELIEKAIKERLNTTGKMPKAIVVADLYGMPAQWNYIREISAKYMIPVLEDSAEALGSRYKGIPCGLLGDLGAFSFNGNKIITTGAGGALVCQSKTEKQQALFYATQAREPLPYYEHNEIGYNYRLSNISAGVGMGQMEVLDNHMHHHKLICHRYCEELNNIDGITVHTNPSQDFDSNYWLSTIILDETKLGIDIEKLRIYLDTFNIESRYLWKPMHLQPIYKSCNKFINGTSDKLWKSGLCLPSGPMITEDDAIYISNKIKSFLPKKNKTAIF